MVSTHHSHDNFNPLRREGGDPSGSVGISWIMDFNPLRREGGDHPGYQGKDIRSNFNPLRREGGDTDPITGKMIPAISIHSAARAETERFQGYGVAKLGISIHSAARAETETFVTAGS